MTKHKIKTEQQVEAEKQFRIQGALDLHEPQVRELSKVVRQAQLNIKFGERELELFKTYEVSEFKPIEPNVGYDKRDDYAALQKDLKLDSMELGLELAKEKLELDIKAYELESAKVRVLKGGEEYYGLSDEDLLQR